MLFRSGVGELPIQHDRLALRFVAVEAHGRGGRVRRDHDRVDVGRVDRGLAADESDAKGEEGNVDTHVTGLGVRELRPNRRRFQPLIALFP